MSGDNFQQRVFAAFPPFPQFVTIYSLRVKFQGYDIEFVRKAVQRLIRLKKVEKVALHNPASVAHVYRRVNGARAPIDMRGHHANGGRKKRAA